MRQGGKEEGQRGEKEGRVDEGDGARGRRVFVLSSAAFKYSTSVAKGNGAEGLVSRRACVASIPKGALLHTVPMTSAR